MWRLIARLLKATKDAWEWYSLLVIIGVVPGVPVLLGVLEGQPWSVLFLYVVTAVAFWVVIFPEAQYALEGLRRRRRRVRFYQDQCCRSSHSEALLVGVENTGRTTISDALVYMDGGTDGGRVMAWVGLEPNAPLDLDPGPPHHHFAFGGPTPAGFTVAPAYRPFIRLGPGDHELVFYVKGRDLTTAPQRAVISVGQTTTVRFVG